MANSVVHIFKNVSMSYQHDGLAELARKKKVNINLLDPGTHVLFLNSRLTRVKMYSANGVISYYRAPNGGRLNLNMIEYIPQCFNAGGGMDWKKADKLALEKLLAATDLSNERVGDLL